MSLEVPPRVWVCDGCMRRVIRAEIADMVDDEHVLCRVCFERGPDGLA